DGGRAPARSPPGTAHHDQADAPTRAAIRTTRPGPTPNRPMQNTSASTQTLTHALSRPVRVAIGVVVFAIATALSAKVQLSLPGTPVPFTFQPLVVLLAGALLGARMGAASQVLYLAAGTLGLPAFAFGGGAAYLLGPT